MRATDAGVMLAACLASGAALAQVPQIQHVVIVTQENRTPDNLFYGLNNYVPGADVASSGVASSGQVVPLVQISLTAPFDMSHAFVQFRTQYDNGKMDGDDRVACIAASSPSGTVCPPFPGFTYIQQSQVQPYFDMAVQYGFANRMFQSSRGPSLPAHLMLLSGTDEPLENSNLDIANNYTGTGEDALATTSGCAAKPGQTAQVIGPTGKVAANIYPCYEHPTLTDVLDAPFGNTGRAISWRYYTNSTYGILDAPNAIAHMCQPAAIRKTIECTGADFTSGKVTANSPQVLEDIMNNNLAAVTWVNPPVIASDHPIGNNGSGPSWVAAIVNAIGQSPYWNNTVILVLWDDWGGFYDHVAPPSDPVRGYFEYGFRVPLLVISPYTPRSYVSNVTHDFGSVLKFVEKVFGLPLIPPGDYADSRADDLSDFFNFNAAPRVFTPISAPYPVSYFLELSKAQRRNPALIGPDPD